MIEGLRRWGHGRTKWAVVGLGLLVGARRLWPERSLATQGPAALWDDGSALLGAMFLFLAAAGLGRWVTRKLGVDSLSLTDAEDTVFSLAFGFGALSMAFFALGCLGWLTPNSVLVAAGFSLLVFHQEWGLWAKASLRPLQGVMGRWGETKILAKASMIGVGILTLLSALSTLTPAWSYDALMYHLPAPREFLEAGSFILLPEMWQANGPMGVELLYAFGLALGSPSIARLTHLSFAVMLVLSSYTLAQRVLPPKSSRLAALMLVGIPVFPVWGSIANIDMAWALYEVLGLYAIVLWLSSSRSQWLRFSAVSIGLAASTKYLGLAAALVVGLLIAGRLLFQKHTPWPELAGAGALALIVGSPWYLLNLFRAGNPVYPFVWGGPGWDKERLSYLMAYLGSFGGPYALWSLPLVPIRLFTQREYFTTFLSSIEFPSPLFLAALASPFLRLPRILRWL
ncbi:MAG: glycosyltransferase family 39 protein, partial [Anaerolineales bacterium]